MGSRLIHVVTIPWPLSRLRRNWMAFGGCINVILCSELRESECESGEVRVLSWNVAAIPEHDLEGFLARLSVEHAGEVLVLPEFVAYAGDSVEATDVGHRVGVGGRFFSCRWYFSRTEVVAVVWVALILQSLGRLNNIMELSSSSSSGIYDFEMLREVLDLC